MRHFRLFPIICAVAIALMFSACSLNKLFSPKTSQSSVAQFVPMKTAKTTQITDSIDENTRQRFNYFYQQAIIQQTLGNVAEAYDLLRYCKILCPDAAEVYFSLTAHDGALNSKAMAAEDIKKAAKLSPTNTIYKESLASYYAKSNDYQNAIKVFEELYGLQPERSDLLQVLVSLYEKVADYPKVISTVNRLENAEGESELTMYLKMNAYSKMGKKKEEYKVVKNFVDKYPNDPYYQVMLGNWLLNNGEKQQALSILQKVLKLDPENVGAQLTLLDYYNEEKSDSIAYLLKHRLLISDKTPIDTKVQIIRQVVSANESEGGDSTKVLTLFHDILAEPQKSKDMLEIYAVYQQLKKMPNDSIIATFKRILDVAPDYANARIQMLSMLNLPDDADEIVDICKSGIEYNPDKLVFYYYLGYVYMIKDMVDETYDVYLKGLAQVTDDTEPSIVSLMYEYVGNVEYERGNIKAAYAAFENSLKWKEDNASCLNNYAYFISVNNGDLDKAQHMSYLTVKAEPTNSTYLDTYAWILFQQERYAEAQVYIDQALQNDTIESYVIIEHGGDIYYKVGNVELAVELWKRAREAGSTSEVLEQKIRQRRYIAEDK